MTTNARRLVSATAIAVFALSGSNASANALASLSLSNFKVTLTDLDPEDGRTPFVVFYWSAKVAKPSGAGASVIGVPSVYESNDNLFSPASASQSNANASAMGSLVGDGSLNAMSFSAAALFARPTLQYMIASGYLGANAQLRLSPLTQLTITADYDLAAETTQGTFLVDDYRIQEAAMAQAGISFWDLDGDRTTGAITSCSVQAGDMPIRVWTDTYPSALPFQEIKTGSCEATFLNTTSSDQLGGLMVQALAQVATVPEPSILMLVVGGIGILGVLRRRVRA